MCSLNAFDLHRIFSHLDKDGDGLISIDQLGLFLDKIGCHMTRDQLKRLVSGSASLDSIDFFLFYDLVVKNKVKGREEKGIIDSFDTDIAEAFKVFDLNGDGFISSEELQSVLLRFGLWDEHDGRDCRHMIKIFDMDSNGLLDFEEFKNMMLVSDS